MIREQTGQKYLVCDRCEVQSAPLSKDTGMHAEVERYTALGWYVSPHGDDVLCWKCVAKVAWQYLNTMRKRRARTAEKMRGM